MSVEYFSWSSPERSSLGERLLAVLSARHAVFEEKTANEFNDHEDRMLTHQLRDDLAQRLKSWCEHFEVPHTSVRGYESVTPGLIGGQSWMVDFNFQVAVNGLLGALAPSDERLYRPKVLERASREVMAWLKERPSDVDRVHPRSFEAIVAEILRDRGWRVEVTKTTRDGGYDVLAIRSEALGFTTTLLVECKLYDLRRAVGIAMVDRLIGVCQRERASVGVLVTNSRFSMDAWKAWESRVNRDLRMVDRTELLEWLEHYGGTGLLEPAHAADRLRRRLTVKSLSVKEIWR